MLRHAKGLFGPGGKFRFIEPAIGTGAFYSALLRVFPKARIGAAAGYEAARTYDTPAAELWKGSGLDLHPEGFTRAEAPPAARRYNLLICDPP